MLVHYSEIYLQKSYLVNFELSNLAKIVNQGHKTNHDLTNLSYGFGITNCKANKLFCFSLDHVVLGFNNLNKNLNYAKIDVKSVKWSFDFELRIG